MSTKIMTMHAAFPNSFGVNGAAKQFTESERRRRRRKKKKPRTLCSGDASGNESSGDVEQAGEQVEIEYMMDKSVCEEAFLDDFKRVFDKYNFNYGSVDAESVDGAADQSFDLDSGEEDRKSKPCVLGSSKKKKKLQRRMKIAELKQISARPDVVEVWDATSADPQLLVFLKSYRNTVPVPQHWCQKRRFLQGKLGVVKKPFQLPDFVAATGIEEVRQAYTEKEDGKKLKHKQRDRMQPKTGNMYIDYQVLHDAFFKYQTKPKLSSYGDLYHEGKEFEVKRRVMKPGTLSNELKEALGMPEGAPPPWLLNMQRYGPPLSYPYLKLPLGSGFGYHSGGWGKPSFHKDGCPVYGDVFGVQLEQPLNYDEELVDKSKHWGDLEDEEENDEIKSEEIKEEMDDGAESVGSFLSISAGSETPDAIDLRKQKPKEPEKSLCEVLTEIEENTASGTLFGTTHTYVVGSGTLDKITAKRVDLLRGQKADKMDVTLRSEELESLDNILAAKYDEASKEAKQRNQPEDLSYMVTERFQNERKRKRKMQENEGKSKEKIFKF